METIGLSKNTACTYLSALSYPHRLAGVTDPTSTFTARKMVETVGNGHVPMPLCKAVTYHMLSVALKTIPPHFPVWESTMYKALLCTAFHLCARVGEVTRSNGSVNHTIKRENITITTHSLLIKFDMFKHSNYRKSYSRVLEADGSIVCPVSLLQAYLHIQPPPHMGPLFLHRDGSVVTATTLSQILLSSLQWAGISTEGITPHSLRIGAATTAAEQGALELQLKLLGCWQSGAYNRYIRPGAVRFKLQGYDSVTSAGGGALQQASCQLELSFAEVPGRPSPDITYHIHFLKSDTPTLAVYQLTWESVPFLVNIELHHDSMPWWYLNWSRSQVYCVSVGQGHIHGIRHLPFLSKNITLSDNCQFSDQQCISWSGPLVIHDIIFNYILK